MKNTLLTLIFFVVISGNAVFAQSGFDAKKLDAFFDALETSDRMMGSVVIAKDGNPIYSRVLGARDISGGKKTMADAETMYRIGSITKVFTAAIRFSLIDEGKITLDTKLSKFFPQIPNAEKITVAHLLSHTSGLANYPQGVDYNDPKSWIFNPSTKQQILEKFSAAKPIFEPGQKRQYSNTNFTLLGYIAESAAGKTYSELLNKTILEKAGLKRTRFGDVVNPGNNEAHSYAWDAGKWNQNSEEHLSNAAGAGGIVSTNADLAKFIDTLFSTEAIISKKSQTEMTTPFIKEFVSSNRGIGVGITTLGSIKKRIFQHDGGVDGFSSLLTYVPEDRVAVSVILNGVNYPLNRIYRAAINSYYGQPFDTPSFKVITLPDKTLEGYEGSYTFKEIGMTITIKKGKGNLIAQATGQDSFNIEPVSETTFTHKESGIIIEFKKAEDGTTASFNLFQQRNTLPFTKDAQK